MSRNTNNEEVLKGKKIAELREIAKTFKLPGYDKMGKVELRDALVSFLSEGENAPREPEAPVKRRPGRPRKNPLPEDVKAAEAPKSKKEEAPESKKEESPAAPAKRRPGRPRKNPLPEETKAAEAKPAEKEEAGSGARQAESTPAPAKRRPGRPRKEPIPENTSLSESYLAAEKKAVAEDEAEYAREQAAQEEANKAFFANRDAGKRQPPEGHRDDRPEVEGILELTENGYGFLRFHNFLTSDRDVYVSPQQIKRFNLKTGDKVRGISRLPNEGERFGALLYVLSVNDDEPGIAMRRKDFSELTPIFPKERFTLELGSRDLAMRLIDLVAPIGKGQRGLIVAAPKAGKTVLLKNIANTIEKIYPEVEMIVLLVDERPEEVTDMKRSLDRGEVIYSTFDEQPQHHVKVAEMVLARAQRLAEHGKDVVILLDSITRLARAYNLVLPASGRTLSGGLDPSALHPPKKFFGAARCLEEGGSITILATALVETGSRMDDVIFEEFKGTGNMELHLDRKLSEKRIFPAIDLNKSGTRREDLLMGQDELDAIWHMRRALSNGSTQDITEAILDNLVHTRTNADFIKAIRRVRFEEIEDFGRGRNRRDY